MKKIILAIVSIAVLSGCTGKQSNEAVNSTSTNSSNVESTETESLSSDSSNISNYTLEAIREIAEKSENLDTVIPDLYDIPDNYNILAEPTYEENVYSFISGSPDDEPVIVTDEKKDIEKYTLSKNPDATSFKEVKQLIEELKQERIKNEEEHK